MLQRSKVTFTDSGSVALVPEDLATDPFTGMIGLVWDSLSRNQVTAHLDANARHHQPHGIVHGGVYAAVAEVMASVGGSMNLDGPAQIAVGISNQTDFLRAHSDGRLDATAEPAFIGETRQLWTVDIYRAHDGKPVARSRVWLFVTSSEAIKSAASLAP